VKILVTGGAGYVGSGLVPYLLSKGHTVTVFDRFLYGAESLSALRVFQNFNVVRGDVREAAALEPVMRGVDAVVHLAGIVGEPACNVAPEFTWSVNRDGVRTSWETASRTGVRRFVFLSTCSNYGVSAPNVEVDENAPLNPLSDYARAKVEMEQLMLGSNGGSEVAVLRLGTICGLAARMRFDLLVSEMARDAALGRKIEIYTPQAWRPFLHVTDAAEAIERVVTAPAELVDRQVYNVVGENIQKTGLIEIAQRWNPDVDITYVDRQPDLRDYRVSGAKIAERLGVKPQRSIEFAFREVAEAVREGWFRDPQWPGHAAVPLDGFATDA
jgi:nucleoside-diphosphate-sugar epimerase